MTREELLKHKEERKGKFLGDLLQNLNSSLQQLDGVYGGDKIERLNKATSRKREIAEQEREKKISSEILNSMNQIKSIEQQTKTAEKELAGLRKKYEKIKDKHFLRQLEQLDQKQTDQLTKLKKEN